MYAYACMYAYIFNLFERCMSFLNRTISAQLGHTSIYYTAVQNQILQPPNSSLEEHWLCPMFSRENAIGRY